jgi:hypothetical protein
MAIRIDRIRQPEKLAHTADATTLVLGELRALAPENIPHHLHAWFPLASETRFFQQAKNPQTRVVSDCTNRQRGTFWKWSRGTAEAAAD